MAHLHKFRICKYTGDLAHLCTDECIEEREYPHMQEPFATYRWSDAHVKPPEPEIPWLDERITYQATGKLVSPFFNKGAIFLKNTLAGYSDKDFMNYVDYAVDNTLANNIRCLLYWCTHKDVVSLHPLVNGKYKLQNDDGSICINPVWLKQAKWRIKYMTDRNMTVRLIKDDNSAQSRGNKHWLINENNWGWDGKGTYPDRHGWTKWVWYADGTDPRATPAEVVMYATTRDYLLALYHFLITTFDGPLIIWETNEIDGGNKWHDTVGLLHKDYGIPRHRMISSPRGGVEWMNTKKAIRLRWQPEVHGIRTLSDYHEIRALYDKPLGPSGDGFNEGWLDVGEEEICAILGDSLDHGNLGYTGNTEGVWKTMFIGDTPIVRMGNAMMQEFKNHLGVL